MSKRAVWAEINLGAIRHNYRVIREALCGGAKLCAVVKANAYGHGALAVAKEAVAAGAAYLAVATLSEAAELRRAGIGTPLLVLGLIDPLEAAEAVSLDVTQTVANLALAKAISAEALAQEKTAKLHLAIDTGMGRIGCTSEEASALVRDIAALPNIELEGAFSHFAMADVRDKAHARGQLALFLRATETIEEAGVHLKLRHIAESAALLQMPEAHLDMVRAGIIQYGMYPSEEVARDVREKSPLRPAMALKARVLFVKDVPEGFAIGYGCTWHAKRRSRIATLPLGYADGYIRALSGKAHVELLGKTAPVVGRICMDQCMIDVTDIEGVAEGTEVTLFGSATLSADNVAAWLGTINYEIPCLIASRVPRVYI